MELEHVLQLARRIGEETLAPNAATVDREAVWPEAGLRRLLGEGLGGLVVPRRFGGIGQGLLGLTQVCETLARACPSTSMCFGMHAVASAVIAAKATENQVQRFLAPIAAGEHLTTLSLSESGSGSLFYYPQTRLRRLDDQYEISGQKAFITNGGHADSYVVSVATEAPAAGAGEFSCVVVPAEASGLEWQAPWLGIGMRGNSSRSLRLNQTRVPARNLLGSEGDQIWYVFEVVAPFFLCAMTGAYLGVAARALELAIEHLKARRHSHDQFALAKHDVLQYKVGTLWAEVERTRRLAYYAAAELDKGNSGALPALLSSKAEVADCCVRITNEAMTLAGGKAFGDNALLAQLLRDARAAHVMAPTTDLLRLWTGRALLGEPLLSEDD